MQDPGSAQESSDFNIPRLLLPVSGYNVSEER
jgi:hypothetical protein